MSCEKYASWMMDGVLGQLSPSHQSELMAHVSNCASCHQVWQRSQRAAELLDQGMDLLVAGEPSPQFTARLCARIADEPPVGNVWTSRIPVAASVLLSAAIVAVAAMSSLKREAAPALAPNITALSSGTVSDAKMAALFVPAVREARSEKLRSHVRISFAPESNISVVPEEMAALVQLDQALQQHRAVGPLDVARHEGIVPPVEIERLEIRPLEIKSIEVSKIQDFTDPWGGY